MRKFTLSMLVLLVSVFFMGQTALGQAMHSKTVDIAEATSPVVQLAKSGDAFDMADMYSIDFDIEVAFTFDFMPWTVNDVDLLPTYGMTGITWTNSGDPQAFIVFNPDLTDPPIEDDPEILAYSGDQFGACLASVPDGANGNNDWFISDMVNVGDGSSFSFMGKSYTDDYGMERFNVAVSTTTNDPAEFTVISGPDYIEAPVAWTPYTYDLSMYAGQDIYVAIQCVTYDAFIFMIDDLVIDPGTVAGPCEDFDALTVGGMVADQLGGLWTTWSGAPGTAEDALVSDLYSVSPANSILVEGTTDLVLMFGAENLTSGTYIFTNDIYVPTGTTGYWNLQKDVVIGTEWGFQIMYEDDMTMIIDAGAAAAAVIPYTYDTWYHNEIIVDLDNDWCDFYIDGVLIIGYQWTLGTFGTAGANTLGSCNFFANPGVGGTPPGAHFDDVCFMEYTPPGDCENFDALTVGEGVAAQLGGYWTTWSGGAADDAMVSDMQAVSDPNSFVVDAGAVDLIFQFGDEPLATGQWLYSNYIYVPTGFSGYFNVQSEPTPGVDWNVELFFDDGGTGSFAGQSTETFVYDQDTWFMVEINYDLDAGLAQILFDGVLITEFVNEMTIGSIDYYGSDGGGAPGAYYDDVCFGPGWIITGIEEPAEAVNSVVYPNPATDRITIESKNIIEEVRIYNNMGQLVYSGQFDNSQIMVNTSTFISGMYIVQIASGEAVEVRKLIIE